MSRPRCLVSDERDERVCVGMSRGMAYHHVQDATAELDVRIGKADGLIRHGGRQDAVGDRERVVRSVGSEAGGGRKLPRER